MKSLLSTITIALSSAMAFGQCADTNNIYTFVYNGYTYEVVKENKNWVDAAACAVERGGVLAEINDAAEQNAVYAEVNTNAGINIVNTVAPDGGGASYVWIGGNDLATEGAWIWDGNDDNNGAQFWQGTSAGNPVGGLYNNWGNEPDDFQGQDGLGLAITDWPLGVSGQWNDVDDGNTLYYVIEYYDALGFNDPEPGNIKGAYPNPFIDQVTIENTEFTIQKIEIFNMQGELIRTLNLEESHSQTLNLSDLVEGMYFLKAELSNGELLIQEIVK